MSKCSLNHENLQIYFTVMRYTLSGKYRINSVFSTHRDTENVIHILSKYLQHNEHNQHLHTKHISNILLQYRTTWLLFMREHRYLITDRT